MTVAPRRAGSAGPAAGLGVVDADLDRIGVSYRKVGAQYVMAFLGRGACVSLVGGPPMLRRSWLGSHDEAMARLSGVPDGAGIDAFWESFMRGQEAR